MGVVHNIKILSFYRNYKSNIGGVPPQNLINKVVIPTKIDKYKSREVYAQKPIFNDVIVGYGNVKVSVTDFFVCQKMSNTRCRSLPVLINLKI